jgi:hypothetical protein
VRHVKQQDSCHTYNRIHFACIQHDQAKVCNARRIDLQLSRLVGRARLSRSQIQQREVELKAHPVTIPQVRWHVASATHAGSPNLPMALIMPRAMPMPMSVGSWAARVLPLRPARVVWRGAHVSGP